VEYNIEGNNQINIHQEIGLTFAAALARFCDKTLILSWWVKSVIWKPQKLQKSSFDWTSCSQYSAHK
jgi:hypothetical protein